MIYEKIGLDGERHLYITKEGTDIPADDDVQLTYADGEGTPIENPLEEFVYFYDVVTTEHQIKASEISIPTADDSKVNVWAGEDLIIGEENEQFTVTFGVTTTTQDTFTIAAGDEAVEDGTTIAVYVGNDVSIVVSAKEGYKFTQASTTISVDGETAAFTFDGTLTSATYTLTNVEADTTIAIEVVTETV